MARVPMGKSEDLPPEITNHPAYKGFKLKLLIADDTKKFDGCNGCVEAVAGTRYIVEGGVDNGGLLHICCAVKPATRKDRNNLKFQSTLPKTSDGERRLCNGSPCRHAGKKGQEKAVNRFVYYDSGSGKYYHPCCVDGSCKCTRPTSENSVDAKPTRKV